MTNDHLLIMRTLANMARQAVHLGRPREAVLLAQRGQERSGRQVTPRVRALLSIREAQGWVTSGEDGGATAVREVEEETGWRPTGPPEHLVGFQPMPGMVDTPHEVYVVRGAEHIGAPTDIEEAGRVEWVPMAEIPDLIKRGEIAGSGSLVGLLYFLALCRAQN